MMFFFRKSKLHIDCFTANEPAIRTAPIDMAIKHIPDWWKALPNSAEMKGIFFPLPTMKKCTGMVDYFTNSLALPLWSDVAFEVTPDREYKWQFADQVSSASIHEDYQYKGFIANKEWGHVKMVSPWICKTKENVGWVFSQPMYNEQHMGNYIVLPGILNFNKQLETNIQLLVNRQRPHRFTISAGQVMAHLTPMSEKEIVVHRHLLGVPEFMQMREAYRPTTFVGGNLNTNRLREKFASCPFSDRTTK